MDASIVWDNPGLALLGVLGVIFLVLLLPIVGALRRSREERFDAALRSREPNVREPGFYEDDYDDDGYDDRDHDERGYRDRGRRERPGYGSYFAQYDEDPAPSRAAAPEAREAGGASGIFGSGPRKRKSERMLAFAPGKGVWFVLGVIVGAGGLALWTNLPAINPLPAVLALFDPSDTPPAPAEAPPPVRADTKVQDRFGAADPGAPGAPAAGGAGGGEGVDEMIDAFVSSLQAQLPMAVGPGISMVNVDSEGNSVALGFAIAQTVAEEDAPKLQTELETRFRSSVCATPPDPTNIHGLNDMGVIFLIDYVDLVGNNVAGLTVEPNFCPDPS